MKWHKTALTEASVSCSNNSNKMGMVSRIASTLSGTCFELPIYLDFQSLVKQTSALQCRGVLFILFVLACRHQLGEYSCLYYQVLTFQIFLFHFYFPVVKNLCLFLYSYLNPFHHLFQQMLFYYPLSKILQPYSYQDNKTKYDTNGLFYP